MTKEEAVKIIEYTFLNADGHLKPLDFDYDGGKGIVEALRMAIKVLSHPSLPSNLNKVAEDRVTENGRFKITPFEKMRIEDIMFGAEWMANQGISVDESYSSMMERNIFLITVFQMITIRETMS